MVYPHDLDRNDPVDFARHLYSHIAEDWPDRLIAHAAREYAAYAHCLAAARQDDLDASTYTQRLDRLDATVLALSSESFWDSVAFGVAADTLRRALLGLQDVAACPACHGTGQANGVPCNRCAEAGYVSVSAPPHTSSWE